MMLIKAGDLAVSGCGSRCGRNGREEGPRAELVATAGQSFAVQRLGLT